MGTLRAAAYNYSSRQRVARRDYRCDCCGGLIFKGESYDSTNGGLGHEHTPSCPDTLNERARRGCRDSRNAQFCSEEKPHG